MMKEGTQASRELIRERNMQPQNGNTVGWSTAFLGGTKAEWQGGIQSGPQLHDTHGFLLLLLSCSGLKISENFLRKGIKGIGIVLGL